MVDLTKYSESEAEMLHEIAAAKGMTIEEVLESMGRLPAEPAPVVTGNETAVFSGIDVLVELEAEPEYSEEPVILEAKNEMPSPPPMVELPEESTEAGAESSPAAHGTAPHICVHCGWNQELPNIAEPSQTDRLSFLQAVLGVKHYTQRFSLFGDKLRVEFRTLGIAEIDAIYTAVYDLQQAGKIPTIEDYYEVINRHRVYLQLISLSGSASPLQITLPSALYGEKDSWQSKLDVAENELNLLLPKVEQYIIGHVLKTENLQRVVTTTCAKFNKICKKLEDNVDNSDFWNETEQQH